MIPTKELGVLMGQINEIDARCALLTQKVEDRGKTSEADLSTLSSLERDTLVLLKKLLDIESEFSSNE